MKTESSLNARLETLSKVEPGWYWHNEGLKIDESAFELAKTLGLFLIEKNINFSLFPTIDGFVQVEFIEYPCEIICTKTGYEICMLEQEQDFVYSDCKDVFECIQKSLISG